MKRNTQPIRLRLAKGRGQSVRLAAGLTLVLSAWGACADPVSDLSNIVRTNKFTYDATGILASTIVEPAHADNCQQTSSVRDTYGNIKVSSVGNCTIIAPPASAVFATKSSTNLFEAGSASVLVAGAPTSVPYLAGQFLTTATGPLGQPVKHTYDARFGALVQETDVNGHVTTGVMDGFGRLVKKTFPDGTYTTIAYCLLSKQALDTSQTSNSANCPTSFATNEVPADASTLRQTTTYSSAGAQISSFTRVYSDRLRRQLRTVTQGYDGTSQPSALVGALVATDTVYDNLGSIAYQAKPYFIATGSPTTSGANDVRVTAFVYDRLGRTKTQYDSNENATGTYAFTSSSTVSYGSYPARKAAVLSHVYSGMSVKDTNALGNSKLTESGVAGNILRITDWDNSGNNGSQVAYQYDAFGDLWKVQDALQNVTTASYDFRGNRLSVSDPDKGLMTYQYDAANQMVARQSPVERAKSSSTTFTYDSSGRHLTQVNLDNSLTWSYDNAASGTACATSGTTFGVLCEVKQTIGTQPGFDRRFQYDSLTRMTAQRMDTGSAQTSATPSFGFGWSYDAAGRVSTKTYPSGLQVAYNYTNLGSLASLSAVTALSVRPMSGTTPVVNADWTTGQVIWAQRRAGADNFLEKEMFADNSFDTHTAQPGAGQVIGISSGIGDTSGDTSIAKLAYVWDVQGNLKSRTDAVGDGTTGQPTSGEVDEGFGYDNLNRLTSYSVTAPGIPGYGRSVSLNYNALGSLLYKSDVGNYAYPAAGTTQPHAPQTVNGVTYQYDTNGNLLNATSGKYSALTYTTFDRVATASSTGSGISYAWSYDEDLDRIKELRTASGSKNSRTLWYLNKHDMGFEYEQDTATTPNTLSARNGIEVGGRTVAILASSIAVPTLSASQFAPAPLANLTLNKTEFWHTDHLGSLVATTDNAGAVTQRYSYDPFGKRRMTTGAEDRSGSLVYDWNPNSNSGTPRGFTGHEQLDDIGIVNMNGRIYDAARGQFMQADSHIPDKNDLQSYNRYSYGRNNPLNSTDPTGFDDFAGTPEGQASSSNWALVSFLQSIADGFHAWVNSFGSDNTATQPSTGNGGTAAEGEVQRVVITGQKIKDKQTDHVHDYWMGFADPYGLAHQNLFDHSKDFQRGAADGRAANTDLEAAAQGVTTAAQGYAHARKNMPWWVKAAESREPKPVQLLTAAEEMLGGEAQMMVEEMEVGEQLPPYVPPPPKPPARLPNEQVENGDGSLNFEFKDGSYVRLTIDGRKSVNVSDVFKGSGDASGAELIAQAIKDSGARPTTITASNILNKPTLDALDAGAPPGQTLSGGVLNKTANLLGGKVTGMTVTPADARYGPSITATVSYAKTPQ